MPITKLQSVPNSPAYNRRKSPRITFHGSVQGVLSRSTGQGANRAYLLQKDDIGIRLADTRKEVDEVGMLVTRMYRRRGYLIPVCEAGIDDSIKRVTLEACYKHRTIGTLTVNLDAAEPLKAETLYHREIGEFRRRGARPCEFTRLAVDAADCGLNALACLFHLGFIFAYRIHRASDLFIEVNPRHALFYRRRLGFEQVGEQKICPRVDAPAVLLHRPLAVLAQEIEQFGGQRAPNSKSFYALGLTPAEERDLVNVIRGLLAESGGQAFAGSAARETASPASSGATRAGEERDAGERRRAGAVIAGLARSA